MKHRFEYYASPLGTNAAAAAPLTAVVSLVVNCDESFESGF